MTGVYPQQKISNKEKTPEWFKENINYFVDQTNYYSGDRWEMVMLYQAAMGILDKQAYSYVLNPYNSTDENLKNYPAQLRNYDIITPILNLFLGEKAQRPFNHQAIVLNPDVPNQNKDELDKAFMAALSQAYINDLNGAGVQTGVPTQEVPPFQKIVEQYQNIGADDKRALFGQEAIDYLKYHLDLKDKYQEAFYDWLVVGRCYTFKDVYKSDVTHDICPTIECWHGTTKTGYIQDCNWFVRRNRYNLNDCIDRFHEVLIVGKDDKGEKVDEVKWLQDKISNNEVATSTINVAPNIDRTSSSSTNSGSVSTAGLIEVSHVCWKGFEKVGILFYTDEFGAQQQMEVSEDYKLDVNHGDIEIEWDWRSKVYHGYRIGEDMFKYCEAHPVQREELSNTSNCKLPYNGRIGYSERNKINSVVKQILPYQALYNIYHFRGELTLARNKDKMMLMPIGLIPDDFGGVNGIDKFLYYAESTGMAFFDETKPNAGAVLNAIRGIDMSLGNYVEQMRKLLYDVKMEAWESIGFNRQRYGDVNSSDGKAVNEQAELKSATISREMCRRFERFEESDIDGMVDYSKAAWIDGKVGMYVTSSGMKAWLQTNPEQHLNTDYKVFAVDSIEEFQKLNQAKQYAFGWAQKSAVDPSIVLEVLDSNNMSKLKNIVRKGVLIQQKLEDARSKAEQEHEAHLEQIRLEGADKDRQVETYKVDKQYQGTIEAASIKAHTDILTSQTDEDPSSNLDESYNKYIKEVRDGDLEKQKNALSQFTAAAQTRLKEVELALKDKQILSKEKLDEKKIKSTEKIASINRNKYSK